ncbi:MAG: aminotransferase class I/II-fold pyridoxal phosphate-dependent enzyme [Solobacterium sp.]|nr:aminotransferase class I/II-fold pyridoxal phosphate-dependent enzyme [Solobacterium sp.]
MAFTRKTADLTPLKDAIYVAAEAARADMAKNPDLVINATIGTLYGEDGKLVALDSVHDHFDRIDHRIKAAYASGLSGTDEFRETVWSWVTQSTGLDMPHSVIATAGGTGAVSSTMRTFLDEGETVIIPDIAWTSYSLMASTYNFKAVTYDMFDGDHLNLASIRSVMEEVGKKQERILLVLNDPCHNPTGYSMTWEEWHALIDMINDLSKDHHIILLDDIAYIDYGHDLSDVRAYMKEFSRIAENCMICICFSCSKTLTFYGLRLGAAVVIAQKQEDVEDAHTVYLRIARSTWSNAPNAPMANFVWVVNENREAYLKEQQSYVKALQARSSLFKQEAQECGLDIYPYKEGFFITLRVKDNEEGKKLHAALMRKHIYTVLVNKGIRVGICALPLEKVRGLAQKIRAVQLDIK